jgi:hypothetical protein
MDKPLETVAADLHGLHGWLAWSRECRQSPGSAGVTGLQQQVDVSARGVVRSAGVFEQNEAGHRGWSLPRSWKSQRDKPEEKRGNEA